MWADGDVSGFNVNGYSYGSIHSLNTELSNGKLCSPNTDYTYDALQVYPEGDVIDFGINNVPDSYGRKIAGPET